MDEADYKQKLVAQVNAMPRAYAERNEDRYAPGRLDMFIKLPDRHPVHAEGKIIKGNIFRPTPAQYVKGERMEAAGLWAVLIGWKKGVMYIAPWCKEADYRNAFTLPKATYAAALDEYLRTAFHA